MYPPPMYPNPPHHHTHTTSPHAIRRSLLDVKQALSLEAELSLEGVTHLGEIDEDDSDDTDDGGSGDESDESEVRGASCGGQRGV